MNRNIYSEHDLEVARKVAARTAHDLSMSKIKALEMELVDTHSTIDALTKMLGRVLKKLPACCKIIGGDDNVE